MKVHSEALGIVISAGAMLLLAAVVFVLIIQPGSSGVIGSIRLPDGSEYMVTQQCNWRPEPYTVSFYMRLPGGKWGWCYIDHQANRWKDVAMKYDAASDTIIVTRQGVRQAALDRRNNIFAIGSGRPSRAVAAPQEYWEPPFPFPG